MFPGGFAGLGLLLLRLAAAGGLSLCVLAPSRWASSTWAITGLGFILILVAVGALTPLVCLASVCVEAYFAIAGSGFAQIHSVLAAVTTTALALLGPGAFSIDAKLFGRRLIVSDQD